MRSIRTNCREQCPDRAEVDAETEDVQILEEVVYRDRDDDPDATEGEGARERIMCRPPDRADARREDAANQEEICRQPDEARLGSDMNVVVVRVDLSIS